MLEANTDRMWFTIGSILIGAALVVLGRNGLELTFTNIMDKTDVFSNTAERAALNIPDGVGIYNQANIDFSQYPRQISMIANHEDGLRDGSLYFERDQYDGDSTYELTFEIQKRSGQLRHIAGHTTGFWGDNVFYLDGVEQGLFRDSYLKRAQSIDDGLRHQVRVVFNTGPESMKVNPTFNINDQLHIQPNRGTTPVDVMIYNLSMRKVN